MDADGDGYTEPGVEYDGFKMGDKGNGDMKSKRNMYPRKCDVMDEIESFVQEQIDAGLLLNQEKAWHFSWSSHCFLQSARLSTRS